MAVLDAAGPQERAAVLLGAQLQGARSPFDGTAAAAATAAAGLLAPKRKRSQQLSMARCDTMAVLATQECECADVKACVGPGVSSSPGGGVWLCSYYAAAAEAKARREPLLYSFLDAPAVLRFNKFVRSGYRAGLTTRQCCASVLGLHNETGNIWTHLLPALLMLALLAGGQLQAWAGAEAAYWVNVGSIAACLLGSCCFHTFMAHHAHYDWLLKLDVCGILLVMCGGGHMVLWWGLACFPATRAAFIAAYVACGAASVWAALRARSARARALPMLGLLLVRLGVYAARAVLERGTARLPGQPLQHYLLLELFTLAGGLVNVARVPERWLQPADPAHPAPLDLWLNSHQIMHVLTAAAMWQLHLAASADYQGMRALASGAATCPAPAHPWL